MWCRPLKKRDYTQQFRTTNVPGHFRQKEANYMRVLKQGLPIVLAFCLLLCGCQTPSAPTSATTVPVLPQTRTWSYLTALDVNFADLFVTKVTVNYEKSAFTATYTLDGQMFQNTYDYQGRLLRQRIEGEDGFWSEENRAYQGQLETPLSVTYVQENFTSTVTRTFDGRGNVLTKHYTSSDGSWNTTTNTYSKDGKLLTEKHISSGGSDTLLTNTYDDNGNLIAEVTMKKGEKTRDVRHTYDAKGRLIQDYVWRRELDKDYIYISTTDFTLDENGNILTQHQQDKDGYWSKVESTYTAGGKLLTETHTDRDGNTSQTSHTYDANGLLLATDERYNSDHTRYAYEYDAAGRQRKRTVIDSAGKTVELTQFVYTGTDLTERITTCSDGTTEKEVRTYDEYGNLLTHTAYYNDTVSSACTYTYGHADLSPAAAKQLENLMHTVFVEFLP